MMQGRMTMITQFGVHHITLPPGIWASQRHHHSAEDEFVYILSGHPTLIDDDGETTLSPGDSCAHPAGDGNGHHLINKTEEDVTFLVVGTRTPETDHCRYPDADLEVRLYPKPPAVSALRCNRLLTDCGRFALWQMTDNTRRAVHAIALRVFSQILLMIIFCGVIGRRAA